MTTFRYQVKHNAFVPNPMDKQRQSKYSDKGQTKDNIGQIRQGETRPRLCIRTKSIYQYELK